MRDLLKMLKKAGLCKDDSLDEQEVIKLTLSEDR